MARDLKYFSPDTNYNALAQELSGAPSDPRLAEDLEKWPEYVAGSYEGEDFESDDEAATA